jgi:hypothetical protein
MMKDALAPDVLEGAEAIAEYLLGDPSRKRSIYHLAKTKQLPVFRLGANMLARKSKLQAWIAEQEAAAVSASNEKAV